jgi:hypothetical protein
MDFINSIHFKKEINGRLYLFFMPNDAPLGETYDVLVDAMDALLKIAKKNHEQRVNQEEKKNESKK